MQGLKGKTVLITGASRGIGAATVRAFAAAGAKVGLAARSGAEIGALAEQVGGMALPCDVGRFGDVAMAVEAIRDAWGRLDILVNNAGMIEPIARIADADPELWGRAVDVNLKGVFHGFRAALPVMVAQGGGTILTISSGAAHSPMEGWSAYCAAKAGAAMLMRAADLEARAAGVRVMSLSPGTVATDMQVVIKASGVNPVSKLDPSVHIPADWPARALVWMCSPDADAHLGQELSLRDEALRNRLGLLR